MTLLLALLCFVQTDAPDPLEIVKKSVEANERNYKVQRNYTYTEREEERELDAKGNVKKTESTTHEVTMQEGEHYYRLVKKNDQPLPPKEEKKEQEKLEKSIREREKETPEQRAKRLEKYEKEWEEGRKFLREITTAYDFRVTGEETIEGRPTWVIQLVPRAGFKPTLKHADVLPKIQGKIWIDKEEYQWARVDLEVIDTISFGLALFRVHKGSNLKFEATRFNDEVWLPKRTYLHGSARLAYFKNIRGEDENTYSGYKKFQVESKLITVSEIPQ